LLTTAGLLALVPYALKRDWRNREPGTGDMPDDGAPDYAVQAPKLLQARSAETSEPGMEELLAQLFSLRMTVSDVAAEVQEARDVLEDDAADDAASVPAEPAKEAA
jgi:hypothetical protein